MLLIYIWAIGEEAQTTQSPVPVSTKRRIVVLLKTDRSNIGEGPTGYFARTGLEESY